MGRIKLLLRLGGAGLLVFLLARVDREQFFSTLARTSLPPVLAALVLDVPVVAVRALRWRRILKAQHISYGLGRSMLSYFGGVFVGMLTPARLGELAKALQVSSDEGIRVRRAFPSVVVDRLFDLYVLVLVGGAALISLGAAGNALTVAMVAGLLAALTAGVALLASDASFALAGAFGRPLVSEGGWLAELHTGLRLMSPPAIAAGALFTVLAYSIFYAQAYLLALAVGLEATVLQVSFAVSLGSLATVLPISVSGIGTREAAVVAYLSAASLPFETAVAFSLLLFAVVYVGTLSAGSVAWLLKPVDLGGRVTRRSGTAL